MNDEFRFKAQELLQEVIILFELKASGYASNAYYVETKNGNKYIVKEGKKVQEFKPQNSLEVEAKVAQTLFDLDLSIAIPKVVFVSDSPEMYGYRYIDGDILFNVWDNLSKEEKVNILQTLGSFHAELGQLVEKDRAKEIGVHIDESTGLHPEVLGEYIDIISDVTIPQEIRNLALRAKAIFDATVDATVFQFLHNDAHHENILIKDNMIVGFIDFGNSEYGEVAREFSRYIRDFPDYFSHIVKAYEEKSGNHLSHTRLVTNSFLSGLADNIEDYKKDERGRIKAEKSINTYREIIESL